ncbi:amidohydrolase family protein [Novosphingobium resinovorum]|uniref:amidohydrolase family protein n=1 Tax=Novosphingobium resinovorum TaxID=158500 RepID=UPI002ED047B9|nr:amidohydrolase family protein [Novosphingobium resinovorum]
MFKQEASREGAAAQRVLDSHQHFWRITAPECAWPDADWPLLHRDFLPVDLAAETADIDLVGTVLVQSQPDDRDTDWLFALAAGEPGVLGVVAWAALDAPQAPARIAALAARPKCLGLRPMLQAIADAEWILRGDLAPAIDAIIAHRLRFDALVELRHLPALARFARRWPALPIVIDHAGKPDAATLTLDPWRADLAALAALPNVWCKLSGLRTQQAQGQDGAALAPYVAHVLESFGARAMWGSDWPVLHHAGDRYGDWIADTLALIGDADRPRLFEGAAREFYGLKQA